MSQSSLSLTSPGDTTQLVATVKDTGGTTVSGATVTWSTSSTAIATVSSGGLVTSVGDGTATITATSGSINGTATATVTCTTDSDGDHLKNCVETNTGTYVSASNTGTNPYLVDTDGDAMWDGEEVLGTSVSWAPSSPHCCLDLPALGVDPNVPDILIEHDWFNGTYGDKDLRPNATQIALVKNAFAAQGINVIQDYGQGGVFTGGNGSSSATGNLDEPGVCFSGTGSAGVCTTGDFFTHKGANMDSSRLYYFHYALHAVWMIDSEGEQMGYSGMAEFEGNDFIMAHGGLGGARTDFQVASTIMHELGHNLNLSHGGSMTDATMNYKPNYNSIMNYQYQLQGIDTDCKVPGEGTVMDFSHGTRPSLNEGLLLEWNGICGSGVGIGFDWSGDNDVNDYGSKDINGDWSYDANGTPLYDLDRYNQGGARDGDEALYILYDYNDWANIKYTGIYGSSRSSHLDEPFMEYTPETDRNPNFVYEDSFEVILNQLNELGYPLEFETDQSDDNAWTEHDGPRPPDAPPPDTIPPGGENQ